MSNRSDDSLDSLFNYEPSRADAEARGVTGSSEASVSPSSSENYAEASASPSPSKTSAEAGDVLNFPSPSGTCSVNNEASASTSCHRGPVKQEEVDYAAVKAEEEAFPFDPVEARPELEQLMASRGASSSRQGKPKRALRHRFRISEAVEFVVPEKNDRADKPPENHFTLYEAFFELCFLWFPIPGVILEYLWEHEISIGQIMPRGLRHMIGILVRSFECGVDIELGHLHNLLEIRRAPGGSRFYISNKSNRQIIGGFSSKDQFWTERFFCVLVNEASVGEDFVNKTKTVWGPLVRSFLPPVPDDLFSVRDTLAARKFFSIKFIRRHAREDREPELSIFSVRDTLAARKVNWRKHLSFERVERARAIFAGVSISSSSSNLSGDTREKMVIITLRDKKQREAEEIARRAKRVALAETEAVPRDDPPRYEGDEVARAADEVAPEATAQEAAPEVEPGEIVPDASGENSAARDKTPPSSAILALPKQSRPPASDLLKHDSSRKRSAAEKGKGAAVQKDEPSKKKCKSAPGEPASHKLVVDDPAASAVMFARVNNANTRLPPSEQLRRSKSYAAMAQRGTKFVAAINEMMAGYESDLVKDKRRLEEAQKEAATAKGTLNEARARIKRLEEEKITLRANVDKVSSMVTRLEESRRAKSAEVALLKRRIEAKDALFDAKVKRATKEVRRELTTKFQERLTEVEEGLAKLDDN
ncbi:uncharacterized protein At3g60930, chloroplastic-like [Eutrema salsugineum]|uniref:uncharacterized protein At3g60930, chloroplastic-like n=1 Tax=Eutrema salsugineum TaxID=72664 RepID=UPI000CECEEF6|nr:uncharacterized protein At3g60930, chloroplastic-like [Eutrema salsugineum]